MIGSNYWALAILLATLPAAGCNGKRQAPEQRTAEPWQTAESAQSGAGNVKTIVAERWVSRFVEADNIDSPSVWHAPDGSLQVIATAKEGNVLVVFDAKDGREIRRVGGTGNGPGQFSRPNGVIVLDDLALVVERDNHRVQVLSLPEFKPLGTFGSADLVKPYGLFGYGESGDYVLYVTDNYELVEDVVPPDSALGRRVKMYHLTVRGSGVQASLVKSFGETAGPGVLHIVESIWGDVDHGVLLIADEDAHNNDIKLYRLDGTFTGQVIGKGLFRYQPEGIVLYETPQGGGWWVMTDQDHSDNTFHVFSRLEFKHLGSFGGKVVSNTDGIALTNRAFGDFGQGAFLAVHNDGAVAIFSWNDISEQLGLGSAGMTGK